MRELQPFGTVQCHKDNIILFFIQTVNIRNQRHFFQKSTQCSRFISIFCCLFVCGCLIDQFINIFLSRLCILFILGIQTLHISRLFDHFPQQIRNAHLSGKPFKIFDQSCKRIQICCTSSDSRDQLGSHQRLIKSKPTFCSRLLDPVDRSQTNAPFWHINDSSYRNIIHSIINRL